jgi:hypothetical protein
MGAHITTALFVKGFVHLKEISVSNLLILVNILAHYIEML